MTFTEHPRLLARVAGAFYLIITAFALFAYMHVRGQLIDTGDMARTANNIVANEQLFRIGFTAAVIVTIMQSAIGVPPLRAVQGGGSAPRLACAGVYHRVRD